MLQRLFWLGLDGADERTLGKMLAEGRLPQIAKRLKRSVFRLPSTIFPITPAAWTSAYTGMNPGKTGVLTWQRLAPDYRTHVVNAAPSLQRSLFTRLGANGKQFVSIGFPMSVPMPNADVALVFPGWDSPPGTPRCNDASWVDRLETLGYRTADEFEPDETVLAENIRAHFRLARAVTEERSWDCLGVYFAFIDTLGHRLGAGNERTLSLLEVVDSEVGAFLEELPFDAQLLVNSDHGFGTFSRSFSVVQWLEQHDFLALRSRSVRRSSARRGLEMMDLRDVIGWRATKAFCFDAVGSFAGIHLNVRGRFDDGSVEGRDAWDLAESIRTALSKEPQVRRVLRREECCWGDALAELPELIVETNPDTVALVAKRILDGDTYRLERGFSHEGTFHSHMPDGMWGASFETHGEPRIEDVAPTIYALLDVAIPSYVDGVNRSPAVQRSVTDAGQISSIQPAQAAYSPEEEELVKQRLEALGYLG